MTSATGSYSWPGKPLFILLSCFLIRSTVQGLDARDVVIVVLSQGDSYHSEQANRLRSSIQQQAQQLNQVPPVVHLIHEDFPHPGAWTVVPLLSRLNTLHGSNSSWIVFCEGHTAINLAQLLHLLNDFDNTQEIWIGHALHDREASIIHHFAFSDDPQQFKYPNFASGFIMSEALLQRLARRMDQGDRPDIDFSIDPSHELALYVWEDGDGPILTHSPSLCLSQHPQCASYPLRFQPCGPPVPKESIYFAVKTCEKFHKDRVPVIKDTWAKHAVHVGFYSEVQDKSIPTINLGVPNTEHGHCGKTLAILKHTAEKIADDLHDVRWVVLSDDDTILSVSRLQLLLSCFDAEQNIALGERYGYNVQHSPQGYNYITGGGGMAFSMTLVQHLVSSGICRCPTNSTPDDMYLGICLARLGVPITHSSLFHQARPLDYAPEYLEPQLPVSFHKHWNIDPLSVYEKWFSAVDKEPEGDTHMEL